MHETQRKVRRKSASQKWKPVITWSPVALHVQVVAVCTCVGYPILLLRPLFTSSAASEVTAVSSYYDSSFTNILSDVILFVPDFLLHSTAPCIHTEPLLVSYSILVSPFDSPSQSVLKL